MRHDKFFSRGLPSRRHLATIVRMPDRRRDITERSAKADGRDKDDGERRSEGGSPPDLERRDFLTTASGIGMAAGLAASYGTFAVMAGRFLYPTDRGTAWMFVVETSSVSPGGSFSYRSPAGVPVMITRSADSSPNVEPPASDFLALSSTCPHLGCRVHWEPHNERFFCPCHSGVFDPSGKPIAGPPKDENQHLSKYPLKVENGLLFIEMLFESLTKPESGVARAAHNRPATDGLADTRNSRIKVV